jgi:hypothetical protein
MKVWSRPGMVWATDDAGVTIFGPRRARGAPDAPAGGGDPGQPAGGHPSGVYRVRIPVHHPVPADAYGPVFLPLEPLDGEALAARERGRSGFGIHGGRLHPDGGLRPTFGCLRVDDDAAVALARLVAAEHATGRDVLYECLAA